MKIHRHTKVTLACLLLLAACLASQAAAQSTFSTLVGNVTDPNNAVVAGASVTVINKGTTATRTATTDSVGNYSIPNLDSGGRPERNG